MSTLDEATQHGSAHRERGLAAHSEEIDEVEGYEFHFQLPKEGLALRSVAIVDGVPELFFTASPKVPTITEEDVAIACRLASEERRPEFFYITIPPGHPFFGRQYKRYCPQWLRGTSVGELLSRADWCMKCLHIGTRSNESKSEFWSWSKTSQLEGLAAWPDFPTNAKPSGGSIIMSCESVRVQKEEDSLVFLDEPKMKIDDQINSLYSKYITEMYPSIAYYDEPLFLKMQELPKLILAAEWLKEKEVRISRKWMAQHTAKTQVTGPPVRRKKPPNEMLPQLTQVKVPSSDVAVKTWEAEQYRCLSKCGVRRLYGWHDHGSHEMVMFTDDGKAFKQQQSMRMVIEKHVTIDDKPVPPVKFMLNIPLPPNTPTPAMTEIEGEITKQLQPSSNEISHPLGPMVVDVKIGKTVDEKSIELVTTNTISPCPPLALPQLKETNILRASVSDYDRLYDGYADPNMPVGITESGEPIIPHVQSWSQLHSESVPWPHTWQMPYIGVGEPAASGGVSTRNIPVTEVPVRPPKMEAGGIKRERVDQYGRCGDQLSVQAQREVTQGTIRLVAKEELEFTAVSQKFTSTWDGRKGSCPKVDCVFAVDNTILKKRWSTYRDEHRDHPVEKHFHGTALSCNIARTQKLCRNGSCGICGISSIGLDRGYIRKNFDFQRFGKGFYLAPNSSKCHDYTQGANGYRAMLLCDVCPGKKYPLQRTDQSLQGPPRGYDSVYGLVGSDLNYPEIVLYKPEAVMPRYIILYRKNGTGHPSTLN